MSQGGTGTTQAPQTGGLRQRLMTGWTLTRVVILAVGGFIGFIVLLFVVAFFMGMSSDAAEAANRMSYIKDLVSIVLSVQGILVIAGIGILIVQMARFVDLLRSEVKPITEDAQQTLKTARATTEFVSKNAVAPIIQTQSFLFGLFAFLREIVRLGRLMKRQQKDPPMTQQNNKDRLHEGAVFQGFLIGAIVGGLMWLWRLPQSGDKLRARLFGAGQTLREKLTPGIR